MIQVNQLCSPIQVKLTETMFTQTVTRVFAMKFK